MVAIANACGLMCLRGAFLSALWGRRFGACVAPQGICGQLEKRGMVETISSLERDGRDVFRDLRWGVYVVFEAPMITPHPASNNTDCPIARSIAAMYKPFHLIGLELSISVLSAALRTNNGQSRHARNGTSIAKRDLSAGEVLDGKVVTPFGGRRYP